MLILELGYLIISFSAAYSDICYNKTVTSYGKIGQELSLLDIDAEEISRLQGPCYMEVKINGAKESEIRVVNAKFGGNHGSKYVGLLGMIQEYIEDKMSIKFDRCSSNSSETLTTSVYTGLNVTFKSDVVCLIFEPETQYKGLGGHNRGGMILILVTVRVALCKPFNGTKGSECEPRCNASGELHNCDSGVHSTVKMTSDQTKSTLKFSTTSPITTHAHQPRNNYSINPTTHLIKTTSVNVINLTSPKPSSQSSTTTLYTPLQNLNPVKGSTEATKFTATTPMLTSLSASGTNVSKPSSQSPKTTSLIKTTPLSTSSTKSFITKSSTPSRSILTTIKTIKTTTVLTGTGTALSRQTVQSNTLSSTTRTTTQTSERNLDNITTPFATDNEKIKEEGVFGLVEGLYIIVGCIVLLLLLSIIGICIRKRTNKSVSPGGTFSGSLPRSALHWRDNWLVRYHNNSVDNASITEPDSSMEYIHGEFIVEPTNTELHHIHHDDDLKKIKCSPEDQFYEPWPVVRLDSDFVKTARSIERERSNGDTNTNIKQNPILTNESSTDKDEQTSSSTNTDNSNDAKMPNAVINELQEKHHFRKHIGSPMTRRGKYDIAKVERSHSRNSGKSSLVDGARVKRQEHKRTKSESHLIHRSESGRSTKSVRKHKRQRNSASVSSEYSVSFEDMLKDEIHNIENALDHDGYLDSESNGSDQTDGNHKRTWKVNTLYAIVSPRNSTSTKDVAISRSHSRRHASNKVDRSESYRKQDKNLESNIKRTAVIQRGESKRVNRTVSNQDNDAQHHLNNSVQIENNMSNNQESQTESQTGVNSIPVNHKQIRDEINKHTYEPTEEKNPVEEKINAENMKNSKQNTMEEKENSSVNKKGPSSIDTKHQPAEGDDENTGSGQNGSELNQNSEAKDENGKSEQDDALKEKAEKEAKHQEFLKNREKFERNGSMKSDKKPFGGAIGTCQFPK